MNKRGGFCKYGNFIWIDRGDREECINPAFIEFATLTKYTEFWAVNLLPTGSGSMVSHEFDTEAEARNFLALACGHEEQPR